MKKSYLQRVMKLLVLFLLAGFMYVSAAGYSQQITFSGEKVPFVEALGAIRKQAGYAVVADKALLQFTRPISIAVRDMPLTDFLIVSAGLFCIGIYIVLAKRNAIQILIGIELIINSAILNLVAFGKYDKVNNAGQSFALFAIVLAAAAVAVALAIILNVYRQYKTIDPAKVERLRG